MGLPPRAYWTVIEAAARWGCMPADIIGWAMFGKIELTTGMPPVRCDGETIAGLVTLPPHDLIPLFRRDGSGPERVHVKRVQIPARKDTWLYITDPAAGVELHRSDIIITGAEAERFEAEYEITRRAAPMPDNSRWPWDEWHIFLIKRVYERGLPPTQGEWIRESLDWFSSRSLEGEAPDHSTVRRKIAPIWQALRTEEPGARPG